MPDILWVTTFAQDMWEASASKLLDSFVVSQTPGKLVAYTEGMDLPPFPNTEGFRLDDDIFLAEFLENNKEVIPKEYGGNAPEPLCTCPNGPLHVHSKKHKLPCVGYWFCRNAFRWLRKVRAVQLAAYAHRPTHSIIIWLDADTTFIRQTPSNVVASWFAKKYACIYMKSKRKVMETGVVGYHLRLGGLKVIDTLVARYSTGLFRTDKRWDDCAQLGLSITSLGRAVKTADLATDVGENSTVIQFTPMGEYLTHDKGVHRRTGVLK